ncbi:periplasmic heavy metal sensor [Marinilabiliaceae bacterium ANBcel2]|nr:periplasmic heavy metal sensor [Marinilabiliaceae bacterium ANBcel2]
MRGKTFILFMVAVAVFLLGAVAYYFFEAGNSEVPQEELSEPISDVTRAIAFQGRGANRVENYLELDSSQRVQFRDMESQYRIKFYAITNRIDSIESKIVKELAKENYDTALLDHYADSIGLLHYNAKTLTINHFIALRKICTDEQLERLSQLFFEIDDFRRRRFERDGERGAQRGRRMRGNN